MKTPTESRGASAANPTPYVMSSSKGKGRLLLMRLLTFLLPLVVLGICVGIFIVMGALKAEPEKKDEPITALPVITASAVQDDVTLSVTAQGEVQPRVQINIVPQVAGRVTYMSPNFIEGGAITKGETLIRIEATEYELRVVQARSQVAAAQTVLAREQTEGAIARADFEDIGSTATPTPLSLREPQMAEAAAMLASAQARYDEAKLMLSRTTITAPFSGRVTLRNVDPGEFITAGTRLGEVYSSDIMDVRLPLTQNDLRQTGLSVGYRAGGDTAPIPVTLSANVGGKDARWQGNIVRTDARFDSQTRVLFAYAELRDIFGTGADAGVAMVPGLFVNAEISGQTRGDVIVIPRAALRGKDQVYVANDDSTLSIKTVEVISTDRDRAVISSGIERAERVITSPIRSVSEGMNIEIVTTTNIGDAANEAELLEVAQ